MVRNPTDPIKLWRGPEAPFEIRQEVSSHLKLTKPEKPGAPDWRRYRVGFVAHIPEHFAAKRFSQELLAFASAAVFGGTIVWVFQNDMGARGVLWYGGDMGGYRSLVPNDGGL